MIARTLVRKSFLFIACVVVVTSAAGASPKATGMGGAMLEGLSPSLAIADDSETGASGVALGPGWAARSDRAYEVLSRAANQAQWKTRGAKEVQLYAKVSPSVVLVWTGESLGSGFVFGPAGSVLTNWHVVAGVDQVTIAYKPSTEGGRPVETDVRRARVARIDEISDLALLVVEDPKPGVLPLQLDDVVPKVGGDVHAIGHPTGEEWTYTRGVVSQVRNDYEWKTTTDLVHRADVIQTQTPINPGNSGGPLLSDGGLVVGINAFGNTSAQGLNFAVAATAIGEFLARKESRLAKRIAHQPCEPSVLSAGRSSEFIGATTFLDLDCDGELDLVMLAPDDTSEPVIYQADRNGDSRVDAVFYDADRDGCPEESLWDQTGDGEPNMQGYHRNCEWEPHRYDRYEVQ